MTTATIEPAIKIFRECVNFTCESFEEQVNPAGQKVWIVGGWGVQNTEQNGNGRTYPALIWEKNAQRQDLLESLRARGVFGELEHPNDGLSNLNRSSHIITKIE